MRRLDVPALIVVGAEDGVADPEIGAAAADLLPRGRLVTMAGCGHAPFLERPADYRSELLSFLREVGS